MLFQKAFAAGAQLAASIKDIVKVELIAGAENVDHIWKDMLDNNVSARRGIMASLKVYHAFGRRIRDFRLINLRFFQGNLAAGLGHVN